MQIHRHFSLIVFSLFALAPFLKAERATTRFIVFGHTKSILKKEPDFLKVYLASINEKQVDYVFILGDAGLSNPNIIKQYRNQLDAEIFFAPGNGEVDLNLIQADQRQIKGISTKRYLKSVGYSEKLVCSEHINFLMINTSDSSENIKRFIQESLESIENDNPTYLMGHHRIWDDSIINETPFSHDKSYLFRELHPLIDGKISHIFAGNSKRQYFNDLDMNRDGKRNIHNMYWCDKLGEILCYSVGMGDGYPKAGYVEVVVENGKTTLIPHYLNLVESEEELLKDEYILADEGAKILGKIERFSKRWWSLNFDKIPETVFNISFASGFVAASFIFGWITIFRRNA